MPDNTTINQLSMESTRRSRQRAFLVLMAGASFFLSFSLSGGAHAQAQMPQAPKAPTAVNTLGDQEAPRRSANRLERPSISGNVGLTLRQAEAQDNDPDSDENLQDEQTRLRRDSGRAEVELNLELSQNFGRSTRFVGQLELSTLRYSDTKLNNEDFNDDGKEEFAFDLERLYLDYRPSDVLRFRLGRQGISDPLEAVVDEDLDGLMVSYQPGMLEFNISHTREDWFFASSGNRRDQISNTMASMQISPSKDTVWMPYVLHRANREDTDPDEEGSVTLEATTWVGVMGIVEPDSSAMRFWFHGSLQEGEEIETDNLNAEEDITELGGFAVNLGINWKLRGTYNTTLTAAAAHASGVSKPDRYRQSDLHSNGFKLNGMNKFRYLGEVLDPELTNIQILTLGLGTQLSFNAMADLAIHSYRQVEVQENKLRGSNIEYDANGIDDDLGAGIDLILTYEPNDKTRIKFTTGRFIPGEAFRLEPLQNESTGEERKHAWVTALELEYTF